MDLALQPIFDAKCISCHDGDPAKPGNRTMTFVDNLTGARQDFTFNLKGDVFNIDVGTRLSGYTASHMSINGR